MANLSGMFSSIFKKLKTTPVAEETKASPIVSRPNDISSGRGRESARPAVAAHTAATTIPAAATNTAAERLESQSRLQSLTAEQLEEFVLRQPERSLVRLLNSLTDTALQLRMVQFAEDEATLKRISRSGQLNKKIVRAADKKLRETGDAGLEVKLQRLTPLTDQMRKFIATPRWVDAAELLRSVNDPSLLDGVTDLDNARAADFASLRNRLQREVQTYEQTCRELEEICQQLESSPSIRKNELGQLQERWRLLSEKYPFPPDFDIFERYAEIMATRRAQTNQSGASASPNRELVSTTAAPAAVTPAPTTTTPAPVVVNATSEAEKQEQEKLKAQRAERNEAERVRRGQHLENIQSRTREAGANLAHRQAGPVLRDLQRELGGLRRWRSENPALFDELEAQLKALSTKRTEVVDEARWDAWARTDLAIRIQTQLEEMITSLETEPDPAVALKNSVGLTAKLHEYAKEMRELGSLERGKDNKIWQKFKLLSDRGWAVCDRMRGLILDQVKTVLAGHTHQPLDFSPEALADQKSQVRFKPSAFADEVPTQIKALRVMWLEIGAKNAEASRAQEMVFKKIFETYFRQVNLQQGQVLRSEQNAIQAKRDTLNEMKIACEGKSTLLARLQVAKRIEDRWQQTSLSSPVAAELQTEFENYRFRLNEELQTENAAHLERVMTIQSRAQEVVDQLKAKSGGSLGDIQKGTVALDAELQATQREYEKTKGLTLPHSPEQKITAEQITTRLQEVTHVTRALLQESKDAALREITERAEERERVLREAEQLAISTDWEASRLRLDELQAAWKKTGVPGQKQHAALALIFESIRATFDARFDSRDRAMTAEQSSKQLKTRNELLYSLEALTRMNPPRKGTTPPLALLPLPLDEDELRTNSSGKLLEAGMRYRQILALDPAQGVAKETKKIMEQWSKLSTGNEDTLPAAWAYFLNRVRALLEIS